jgi:hypothetical protein
MPLAGFEPAIPASERPQTHALDRAVTGIIGISLHINTVRSEINSAVNCIPVRINNSCQPFCKEYNVFNLILDVIF